MDLDELLSHFFFYNWKSIILKIQVPTIGFQDEQIKS